MRILRFKILVPETDFRGKGLTRKNEAMAIATSIMGQ
jgi:hypothetical protein